MRGSRVTVGLAMTGLALVAVPGCDSGGPPVDRSPASEAAEQDFPASGRVSVSRPGFIDTNIPAASLPAWPGPAPRDFLAPSPPQGESGVLAGEQAAVVYSAALENPDSYWNVGGIVEWLVVTPS